MFSYYVGDEIFTEDEVKEKTCIEYYSMFNLEKTIHFPVLNNLTHLVIKTNKRVILPALQNLIELNVDVSDGFVLERFEKLKIVTIKAFSISLPEDLNNIDKLELIYNSSFYNNYIKLPSLNNCVYIKIYNANIEEFRKLSNLDELWLEKVTTVKMYIMNK